MKDDCLFKKAFKILRRNYGCPGTDSLTIKDIKRDYSYHAQLAVEKYLSNEIGFLPVKKTTIVDCGNKHRDIYVYCLYERWIQQYIKLQIEPLVEKCLKNSVFGYRKGFDMTDLVKYIKSFDTDYVFCVDVMKFYDHINKNVLFDVLSNKLRVPAETINKIKLSFAHLKKGLPQGNVLSPTLSNVYLFGIDNLYTTNYARYSDDMFFAINDLEDKGKILNLLQKELSKIDLTINFDKIKIIDAKKFE